MDPQTNQPMQPPVAGAQSPLTPLAPAPAAASLVNHQSPQAADDGDVIEREWVMKAEQIVAQTKPDPYAQAKALNGLKADYIQKRYGKEVKVAEE